MAEGIDAYLFHKGCDNAKTIGTDIHTEDIQMIIGNYIAVRNMISFQMIIHMMKRIG
jgi:hypothetical protein